MTEKSGLELENTVKNQLMPLRAVIEAVKKETADVKTYSLRLRDSISFDCRPGQFNMVGSPGIGEAPISVSSIKKGGEIEHTIRAIGRVTEYIGKLAEGDEILLRGPYGSGWPLDKARGGDVLIVAGGLGLAPLRPAIEAVLKDRGYFDNVALVYGARDPLNVIFAGDLLSWKEHFTVIQTVDEAPKGLQWLHEQGLVTDFIGNALGRPEKTTAFVCGPEIMMRFVARRLILEGVSAGKLYVSLERRMKCGTAQCGHCQHGPFFVCKDGPVFLYRNVQGLPDGLL